MLCQSAAARKAFAVSAAVTMNHSPGKERLQHLLCFINITLPCTLGNGFLLKHLVGIKTEVMRWESAGSPEAKREEEVLRNSSLLICRGKLRRGGVCQMETALPLPE